jgi:crotonobetainyl-CoA:carnitine CoA-transferase CaiB-like acyl-CoA transferase
MDLLDGKHFAVVSFGVAAGYAAWLLSTHGARVDHQSALDPGRMGAFLARGASFTGEPAINCAPGGTLITDAPVNTETRKQVEAVARDARVVWITPWGLEGSWSERPASDLAAYAAGGWMYAVGEPGREPIALPGAQGQFLAGLFGAIAALSGEVRGSEVRAGLVDIAMVDVLAATTIYDTVAFQYHGITRTRVGNRFSPGQATLMTMPCKDGYVGIHAALHGQWASLARLIGHPELADDPRFRTHTDRSQRLEELDSYLLPWLAERTRLEAYHELQHNRIPSSYLPDIAEVLEAPHLREREVWQPVSTPGGKQMEVPGPVTRVMAAASAREVPEETGGPSPWEPGKLRVVDLSMGWAGPLVTHILAALGADVIKVESHTHFDWWRGSRPPGSDNGLRTYEWSHVFNSANRGKRGITLNLATPRGLDILRELIREADVLVENFGAGVLEKMDLSYERLSAENPRLVMLRQPGFGSDGPESHYLTFGNTIEGNSGLSSLTGYADGPPMMVSNALGDPVSGLTGTTAVLAGLAARRRTGAGCKLECAQIEGFLPLVSEALIEFQETGSVPTRRGNVRPGHTPSGAYRCAGDDAWVVLEVRSDEEWSALAERIGEPWARDERLACADDRERCRDEVDERLQAWTRVRTPDEVVEACVAAEVPAAPVCNEAALLSLGPLVERDFWEGQEREIVGFHMYPSLPFVENGTRLPNGDPAPLLGQHTEEVLSRMGLDHEAIEALELEGVIGYEPVG